MSYHRKRDQEEEIDSSKNSCHVTLQTNLLA